MDPYNSKCWFILLSYIYNLSFTIYYYNLFYHHNLFYGLHNEPVVSTFTVY